MKESKRMLVIRFSALGDVAMTLPVVYSLANRYPDLQIDYVTSPFFARLFIDPPVNLHVHAYNIKKDFHGLMGIFSLFKKLSALKPDYVADLHNVFRTWIIDSLFRLSGVKVVMLDKMRSKRNDIIKRKIDQPSFIRRYEEVFGHLGYPLKTDFSSIFKEKQKIPIEINHPAVGIAPFARFRNKTYPAELIKSVIKKLTEKGINVYLFGAKGEEAAELEDWCKDFDRCVSLGGKFPIEEELAIMGEMNVMVSMDSANHHLASLSATSVVSLWGSTTPGCGFMAYNQPLSNALSLNLSCQPCTIAGSPGCKKGDFACMNNLTPDTVVNKIISLISHPKELKTI